MKHPAYQLRHNKAIDRFILLEILKCTKNISDYTYVSLGGPFLEDFQLVHSHFPRMKMISLEKNKATFDRQSFHKITRFIKLKNESYDSFISNYEIKGKACIWLDYTKFDVNCINDFIHTLPKVEERSIVKITLRSELPECSEIPYSEISNELKGRLNRCIDDALNQNENQDEIKNRIQNVVNDYFDSVLPRTALLDSLAEYLPSDYKDKLTDRSSIRILIQQVVMNAANKALDPSSDLFFMPLNSSYYNDGTEMMSITGIVIKRQDEDKVNREYSNFKFKLKDWYDSPSLIDVPILSTKERLYLQKYLPRKKNAGENLHKLLGYKIDDSKSRTIKMLGLYNDFYSYYPVYGKILL